MSEFLKEFIFRQFRGTPVQNLSAIPHFVESPLGQYLGKPSPLLNSHYKQLDA